MHCVHLGGGQGGSTRVSTDSSKLQAKELTEEATQSKMHRHQQHAPAVQAAPPAPSAATSPEVRPADKPVRVPVGYGTGTKEVKQLSQSSTTGQAGHGESSCCIRHMQRYCIPLVSRLPDCIERGTGLCILSTARDAAAEQGSEGG